MSQETSIYILRLTGGRYYVGKSDNVLACYDAHEKGTVATWTRRFAPTSIVRVTPTGSVDAIVKEYMAIYGIDMVRGGSYEEEELPVNVYNDLHRELCKTVKDEDVIEVEGEED